MNRYNLFVYEHVTGGGFLGQPLPDALVHEGDLMLRALVHDLTEIRGLEVNIMRDPRLPPLDDPVQVWVPNHKADLSMMIRRAISESDGVWPIVPEQGGLLERISRLVKKCGAQLYGSAPEAVRVAASKTWTSYILSKAGVPVVKTYSDIEIMPDDIRQIVIKPDDGMGCIDTKLFCSREEASHWLHQHKGYVAQPYIAGEPISLSLLCAHNKVTLLSCNKQRMALENGYFSLRSIAVNAMPEAHAQYMHLAQRVVNAIPGLWGYVGIDLIITETGPLVLEVNPRITSSYAGLRRATGINPAAMVLSLPHMAVPKAVQPKECIIEVEVNYA